MQKLYFYAVSYLCVVVSHSLEYISINIYNIYYMHISFKDIFVPPWYWYVNGLVYTDGCLVFVQFSLSRDALTLFYFHSPGCLTEFSSLGCSKGILCTGCPKEFSSSGCHNEFSSPGFPKEFSSPGCSKELSVQGVPKNSLVQGVQRNYLYRVSQRIL